MLIQNVIITCPFCQTKFDSTILLSGTNAARLLGKSYETYTNTRKCSQCKREFNIFSHNGKCQYKNKPDPLKIRFKKFFYKFLP